MKRRAWKWLGVSAYWLLLPLIYIYAAVTKPRARVLLIHDSHALVVKNWLGAGAWALPGGGIERNELPADAAIREIREELGFVIEPGALRALGEHTSIERGGLKSKYHLFAVELIEKPTFVVKADEIVDYTWLSFTQLTGGTQTVGNTVKQSVAAWLNSQNLVS